jgi:hypothetical protein
MSSLPTRVPRHADGAAFGPATDRQRPISTGDSIAGQLPHAYIDTPGAAKRLGVSARTLIDFRCRGGGPKWVRIARAVRYRTDWLDEWAEEKAVTSTSEETARAR